MKLRRAFSIFILIACIVVLIGTVTTAIDGVRLYYQEKQQRGIVPASALAFASTNSTPREVAVPPIKMMPYQAKWLRDHEAVGSEIPPEIDAAIEIIDGDAATYHQYVLDRIFDPGLSVENRGRWLEKMVAHFPLEGEFGDRFDAVLRPRIQNRVYERSRDPHFDDLFKTLDSPTRDALMNWVRSKDGYMVRSLSAMLRGESGSGSVKHPYHLSGRTRTIKRAIANPNTDGRFPNRPDTKATSRSSTPGPSKAPSVEVAKSAVAKMAETIAKHLTRSWSLRQNNSTFSISTSDVAMPSVLVDAVFALLDEKATSALSEPARISIWVLRYLPHSPNRELRESLPGLLPKLDPTTSQPAVNETLANSIRVSRGRETVEMVAQWFGEAIPPDLDVARSRMGRYPRWMDQIAIAAVDHAVAAGSFPVDGSYPTKPNAYDPATIWKVNGSTWSHLIARRICLLCPSWTDRMIADVAEQMRDDSAAWLFPEAFGTATIPAAPTSLRLDASTRRRFTIALRDRYGVNFQTIDDATFTAALPAWDPDAFGDRYATLAARSLINAPSDDAMLARLSAMAGLRYGITDPSLPRRNNAAADPREPDVAPEAWVGGADRVDWFRIGKILANARSAFEQTSVTEASSSDEEFTLAAFDDVVDRWITRRWIDMPSIVSSPMVATMKSERWDGMVAVTQQHAGTRTAVWLDSFDNFSAPSSDAEQIESVGGDQLRIASFSRMRQSLRQKLSGSRQRTQKEANR